MKRLILIAAGCLLASCSGPRYQTPLTVAGVGGKLFLVGGEGCPSYKLTGPDELTCYDRNGKFYGTKTPIPAESLSAVQNLTLTNNARVQIENQQAQIRYERDLAELNQSLGNLNRSSQQWAEAFSSLGNSQMNSSVSLPMNAGTATTTCIASGNVFTCRSPADAARFVCISSGSYYHCRAKSF